MFPFMSTTPDNPLRQQVEDTVRLIGEEIRTLPDGRLQCPVCQDTYSNHSGMGAHIAQHWEPIGLKIGDPGRPRSDDLLVCPKSSACKERHLIKRANLPTHLVRKHSLTSAEASGIARVAGFDIERFLAGDPVTWEQYERPTPRSTKKAKRGGSKKLDRPLGCPFCNHKSPTNQGFGHHLKVAHGIEDADERTAMRNAARGDQPAVRSAELAVVEAEPKPDLIDPADAALAVVMSSANGSIPTELLPDVVAYIEATRDLIERIRAT